MTQQPLDWVRNGFGDRVKPSGEYESTAWGTKRVRWQWEER